MTVVPYKESEVGKKEQVAEMFNHISPRYDFLNHFFSLGIDFIWRKKAINLLKKEKPRLILDVATGTGDFAIAALKLNPEKVIGADISSGMLERGMKKIRKKGFDKTIDLVYGDSENLQFDENTFDAITVGFGVRNFENLEEGLKGMHRVLKKNGTAVVLEFSKPTSFPVKQVYWMYFKFIVPTIGRLFSRNKVAYTYLHDSVAAFPEGNQFLQIMNSCGFANTKRATLSGGIASIYIGKKPE